VPSNIRDSLIQIFIKYGWQFTLEFNGHRFISSLDLPPTHPHAPHPALLNAIFLNGCIYSNTTLRRYEAVFYQRTCKELALSLAHADRLFDFIRASALVACYLFGKGRYAAGQNRLSTILRFAMACGLHAIDSLSLNVQSRLLPPCADLIELGERINMFWTLFCCDRVASLKTGVPYTISDENITTIWPCPSGYYEDSMCFTQPLGSVMSLYGASPCAAYRDNYLALRVKGIALLHRACVLSARVKSLSWMMSSDDKLCLSREHHQNL